MYNWNVIQLSCLTYFACGEQMQTNERTNEGNEREPVRARQSQCKCVLLIQIWKAHNFSASNCYFIVSVCLLTCCNSIFNYLHFVRTQIWWWCVSRHGRESSCHSHLYCALSNHCYQLKKKSVGATNRPNCSVDKKCASNFPTIKSTINWIYENGIGRAKRPIQMWIENFEFKISFAAHEITCYWWKNHCVHRSFCAVALLLKTKAAAWKDESLK